MMAGTESLFRQLVDCLNEQEEILERLIASGKRQFKALRINDLEGLNKTVGEQQSDGLKMEEAERRRLAVQALLEEELFIGRGASTLKGLVLFAPDSLKTALQIKLGVLNNKLNELKEINSLNSRLIKNILLLNERLLKLLAPEGAATYDPKGGLEGKAKKLSVLNKSV
ncbi:MAG TPA: flagellar export chaperone FlgN [Bacillota bacterium]|nr:flagellar export chaperone FlgN [Bacillota bacterium]